MLQTNIISFILTLMTCPILTMTIDKDTCYNKANMRNRTYYCPRIKNTTRIILSDDTSNYLNYFGGQLKILKDNDIIVFYNCPNHKTITQVHSYNFSLVANRRRQGYNFGRTSQFPIDVRFQSCLYYYCRIDLDSIFFCEDNSISNLNFGFSSIVNIPCLATITFGYINSLSLVDINSSNFFTFAVNLVKLVISGSKNIKMVKCDFFYLMYDLRILRIFNLGTKNALCIFKFNPSLASISNGTYLIWNMCNGTFDFVKDLYFVPNTTATATATTNITTSSTCTFVCTSTSTMALYIFISVVGCVIILIVLYKIAKPYQLLRTYFYGVGLFTGPTNEDFELEEY